MASILKCRLNFEYFETKVDPQRFCFSEFTDSENVVRKMSIKSRFRRPFEKQHGKRAKALPKSISQHLYHIHWWLSSQLSWNRSLLLTCKILVLLVNALTADEKYSILNRNNLTIPVQIQLPEKQKTFFQFLASFLKFRLDFKRFEKKMFLIAFVFLKLRTPNTSLVKCLKSPVSEDPSTSNMTDVPKHCWNLHHTIFIILIDLWQVKRAGKSLYF